MDQEEYLSDASLIEDDDEEEEEEEIHLPYPMPTTVVSTMSYENTREITRVMEIEEANGSSEDEEFHGFNDHDISESADMYIGDAGALIEDDDDKMDLSAPFPSDMNCCLGWYPAKLPNYRVKFAPEETLTPTKISIPTNLTTNNDETIERKVKPLKIKKTAITNFSTPSPLLQRESREWKPSSQFFKPLNAGMNVHILNLNVKMNM